MLQPACNLPTQINPRPLPQTESVQVTVEGPAAHLRAKLRSAYVEGERQHIHHGDQAMPPSIPIANDMPSRLDGLAILHSALRGDQA